MFSFFGREFGIPDFGQVARTNLVREQASCAKSDAEMVLGSFVCLLV